MRALLAVAIAVALAWPARAAAQEAPTAPDVPVLHLYYAETTDRLDELRAALAAAAGTLGVAHAEYDMGDEAQFRALLRLEEERGIHRYANVELFAGRRYYAGTDEVLGFLHDLAAGRQSLDPPEAPETQPPQASGPATVPQSTASAPAREQHRPAYRNEAVQALPLVQRVGPWEGLRRWCGDLAHRHGTTALVFLGGLLLGLGLAKKGDKTGT